MLPQANAWLRHMLRGNTVDGQNQAPVDSKIISHDLQGLACFGLIGSWRYVVHETARTQHSTTPAQLRDQGLWVDRRPGPVADALPAVPGASLLDLKG